MRRLGIAICLLSLWAAPVWAEQENPDPPPDDEVNCPEGTTPMEGGASCQTEPGDLCPDGWTEVDSEPGPGGMINECACDGTTDPLGNCSDDGFECTDGYIELEGMDTCVLDPGDPDGLGSNGEVCPAGFEQIGGSDWGICYCPTGHTIHDGASCSSWPGNHTMSCTFGAPACIDNGGSDFCWCEVCPDGFEISPVMNVCIPGDYGGFPVNQPPPPFIVMWGQDHVERLDFDPVDEGYEPSPQIHWYTGTDVCEIGYVALDGQCVEACTLWELPCVDDPDALYVYDPKIWIYD